MKTFWEILITVVLVSAAATGMYFYQQSTIDELTAKNKSLTNDIKKLKADSNTQSTTDSDKQSTSKTYKSEKGVSVMVNTPSSGAKVTSPLTVTGSVPGSWSFEAQFSVRLIDAQGNLLADSPAKLQGDWMTDKMVPFTATLSFGTGASKNGTLVLLKANPSGLDENNDSVVIPVTF